MPHPLLLDRGEKQSSCLFQGSALQLRHRQEAQHCTLYYSGSRPRIVYGQALSCARGQLGLHKIKENIAEEDNA